MGARLGDAMLARLVGIILGLILASSGYVVAGWGSLGTWATNLDLGPFEPHRPAVGVAATIVGGVLIVAALLPRPKRKTRKTAPARLMGLGKEHGLKAGARADFVVTDCIDTDTLVAGGPDRAFVFSKGRLVSQSATNTVRSTEDA